MDSSISLVEAVASNSPQGEEEERDNNTTTTTVIVRESTPTTHMDLSDDEDEDMISSPDSSFEGQTILHTVNGDITSQLASAGPTGVAAAAAISSTKRRKRNYSFETNPSIRKRQQTRLLRKLRHNIEEFSLRVGQQAVILVATPGKQQNNFKVFGAKPLEDVIKNLRAIVMNELETALSHHTPPQAPEDPSLHELPPLVVEGIPTPVEKMTQAQLRAFIPLMLKYSTGRGKPGWGKESTRPVWWPGGVPWANVRMDARKEEHKAKVSWTHALRQIVINCYKYHGRGDLLPSFDGEQLVEDEEEEIAAEEVEPESSAMNPYAATMVQTISNSDGSVSIIRVQVDPSNPVITLPDGSTATVQTLAQLEQGSLRLHSTKDDHVGEEEEEQEQVLESDETHTIEITQTSSGELQSSDGHILIASEDGTSYPVSVGGVITVPVSSNMYQAVVANMQGGDFPIQFTSGVHSMVSKVDSGSALTITPVESNPSHEESEGSQFIATRKSRA